MTDYVSNVAIYQMAERLQAQAKLYRQAIFYHQAALLFRACGMKQKSTYCRRMAGRLERKEQEGK